MLMYVYLKYASHWLSTRVLVQWVDKEKCTECYIYANFAIGWDQVDADNAENVMSHSGYVIM